VVALWGYRGGTVGVLCGGTVGDLAVAWHCVITLESLCWHIGNTMVVLWWHLCTGPP